MGLGSAFGGKISGGVIAGASGSIIGGYCLGLEAGCGGGTKTNLSATRISTLNSLFIAGTCG